MKNQKHLFNNLLMAYNKCIRKLTNLRIANRNHRRQGILEKNLIRLHKKLLNLQAIFQKAALATAVAGALACIPQTSAAQTFAASEINPFGLATTGYINAPDFADLDGDGDLDMMSSVVGYGDFLYFENTGTVSTPAFATPLSNPFGLVSTGYLNITTFADLDDDGDFDIMAVDTSGDFLYFENTGIVSTPAFTSPLSNPFGLESIEFINAPDFADLDGDGDLDMMSGEFLSGNILYFKNTGSAATPAFAAPVINPFELEAVPGDFNDPEFVDLDGDGDFDIMSTGGYYGVFLYFMNTGTATAPSYASPQTDPFGLVSTGEFIFTTFADLDGDGDFDIMSVDYYGNYLYFKNDTITGISPISLAEELGVILYPNPNNGQFTIEHGLPAKIEIIDAIGRVVYTQGYNERKETINLDQEENGIYAVKVISNGRQIVHQVVINK
ncbi:MAG: T9SS type A sorting domain-containing protein [Saprospiraceae bacterium]